MLPTATYRLQFHAGFPFSEGVKIAGYLRRLGVSHVYSSPILTARAGSNHGYDVVDYGRINLELGGEEGFRALAAALKREGIGILLDIVPNHMAVGGADNVLWLDVLRNGRSSDYAGWFDIDFDSPDKELKGKILCPFLGAPYEEVLPSGDLKLVSEPGPIGLAVAYHHHRFPIRNGDAAEIEEAGLAAYDAPDRLHALLEKQNFRLAWWRVAGDKVNFRRFFEITELAGIEIGVDEAFEAAHAITFRLYAEGLIDGVRIDHIDGLADPAAYCRKLRARLARLETERPQDAASGPAYLVVEKILGAGEPMPEDWQTDGTTGYDFMNEVSALQHDETGGRALTALWVRLSNRYGDFEREECIARRELLRNSFDGQRETVVDALKTLADCSGIGRDLTWSALRRGLTNLIEQMRVYRSYATGRESSPAPGAFFERALARALDEPAAETRALRFIERVMRGGEIGEEAKQVQAVRRFNQLCAPVAAKAVEDTAFYRYGRLLSRNDVGFEAAMLACPAEEFHNRMASRVTHLPRSMLTTATHDHKRGEDVRARLAVLSEMAEGWSHVVMQWFALNEPVRPKAVHPADEYQLYQMLFGAWPLDLLPDDVEGLNAFAGRMKGWQSKSLREAKLRSSWNAPNEAYETLADAYLDDLLNPAKSPAFLRNLTDFVDGAASAGAVNSLAQAVLRCTLPGMPDLYQGTEFWDFSLVDPDNRRPVDYEVRATALERGAAPAELLSQWRDGRVKQAIIARLLDLRRRQPALFAEGDYRPLQVEGRRAASLFAFSRSESGAQMIVLVPLHCSQALAGSASPLASRDWWGDTAVLLPDGTRSWRSVLEESEFDGGKLLAADAFSRLPVGAWIEPAALT